MYWVQIIYKRVQAANRANIQRLHRQLLQQHTVMIGTILYVPMQINIGSSIKLICGDLMKLGRLQLMNTRYEKAKNITTQKSM